MKSMTGYGRGESSNGQLKVVVEIKAVNHRYGEITVKQPRQYLALEDKVKKLAQSYVERGRVEIFVRSQELAGAKGDVQIDQARALAYHQGLQALAEALGEDYQLDIYRLAALPDVIIEEEREANLDAVWPVLEAALREAMANHLRMRETEGASIQQDMLQKLGGLAALTARIAERSALVPLAYKERLQLRIAELAGDALVSEERLAQEVAYFSEKSCIDEELVRLQSHFSQFKSIAEEEGSIGRKLDFLIQEMNRETNTIGSKANDLAIGQIVVEMKSELEKLREQVQNIE